LLLDSERVSKLIIVPGCDAAPLLDYGLSDARLKAQCTPGNERRISRWEHETVLETVQDRRDRNPDKMRMRRQTVGHPFGTIKERMRHALLDEKIAESGERNGAARAGLRHEARDADSGRWRIDGGNPHMRRAA
jgi:hypothetical protein